MYVKFGTLQHIAWIWNTVLGFYRYVNVSCQRCQLSPLVCSRIADWKRVRRREGECVSHNPRRTACLSGVIVSPMTLHIMVNYWERKDRGLKEPHLVESRLNWVTRIGSRLTYFAKFVVGTSLHVKSSGCLNLHCSMHFKSICLSN